MSKVMNSKDCYLIGNTSWGYCFKPMYFDSISAARKYGNEMKSDGYWFAYRIVLKEKK